MYVVGSPVVGLPVNISSNILPPSETLSSRSGISPRVAAAALAVLSRHIARTQTVSKDTRVDTLPVFVGISQPFGRVADQTVDATSAKINALNDVVMVGVGGCFFGINQRRTILIGLVVWVFLGGEVNRRRILFINFVKPPEKKPWKPLFYLILVIGKNR